MKTAEELNALKNEIEALNKKLAELSEEELAQVTGGLAPGRRYWPKIGGSAGAAVKPEAVMPVIVG